VQWQRLQALAHSPAQQEEALQQLWSLKESLAKATGLGLAFSPLSRAAFSVLGPGAGAGHHHHRATLLLDGAPAHE
jgi:phosphopantetheinyl transferase